ncbi:hypothetical protein MN0502_09670 [Arthrobacter sp. MN05-02]|nr:hypothetical protein MN0502_09670 [Arthrobacter sp. MN05-02]
MPQTPAGILARMRSVSSSSPRLVWHGLEGRIELSGRVFDNWVAKSANLLADELDATDGTTVAFDLPVHWKSLALAFACWRTGSLVVLPGGGPAGLGADDADIVLSADATVPVEPPRSLVCVALGSLALGWDGPLPRGAVDFAAEVRSQGDAFFGADADATAPLLQAGGRTLTGDDLERSVVLPAGAEAGQAPTVLLEPGADLLRTLAAALAVWQQDGALVLVEEGVPVTGRLLTGERVTGRLGTA